MSHDLPPPSDPEADPYVVGPRRPPKHTRFKPGQSGNPRGRPKQTLSRSVLSEIFADALLNTEVTLTKAGQPTKVSLLQAAIAKQGLLALNGDTRALACLLASVERIASYDSGPASADDDASVDHLILSRGLDAQAAGPGQRVRGSTRSAADGGVGRGIGGGSSGEQDPERARDDLGEAGDA